MAIVSPVPWTDEGTVAARVESSGAVGMLLDVAAPALLTPASPATKVPAATTAPPVIRHLRSLVEPTMFLLVPGLVDESVPRGLGVSVVRSGRPAPVSWTLQRLRPAPEPRGVRMSPRRP